MSSPHPHPGGVLHLVAAPESLSGCPARVIPATLCARAIEDQLTPPGKTLLISDSAGRHSAKTIGLQADITLNPPLGRIALLSRSFRAIALRFERIVCWNDELAPLLRHIDRPCELISTRPQLGPNRVSKRVEIRVFEREDRDVWEARNHPAELDTVLAPLVDHTNQPEQSIDRDLLDIDEQTLCIGAIADKSGDVDARAFCFLLGLLSASGYKLCGIVPAGASHLPAARRHHRGLDEPFKLMISDRPITSILPLFDALIHPCFDGTGSSMLLERLCENAEVPVLRLKDAARDGLSRAPGVAGPIIDALDEINAQKQTTQSETHEMAHA